MLEFEPDLFPIKADVLSAGQWSEGKDAAGRNSGNNKQ